MDITPQDVDFLETPAARAGADWLHKQSRDTKQRLALIARLRKDFTPHQGSLLLEQWELQEIARQREVFKEPIGLLLEREALQQATCWEVGARRAGRIRGLIGPEQIAEVGCALGGDSLELRRQGELRSWEMHPGRARLAQHNVPGVPITAGDFFDSPLPLAAALFVDPARRADERRIFHPELYQPPLSKVVALRERYPLVVVKAGPGIADEHLPPQCQVEFISHNRTCKEAVLWLHPGAAGRLASVHTPQGWMELLERPVEGPGIFRVGGWLHEPDGAVLRARASGHLAEALQAGWLDPKIGYLVGEHAASHPLAQSFEILDIGPLHAKTIQKKLQGLQLAPLEIKKRGVELEPEQYRKQLKIKSGPHTTPGVLILTRRHDEHLAILARRA